MAGFLKLGESKSMVCKSGLKVTDFTFSYKVKNIIFYLQSLKIIMFFQKVFSNIRSHFLNIFKRKLFTKGTPSLPFPAFWAVIQKGLNKFLPFLKRYWKFFVTFFLAILISDLLLIKSYVFLIPDQELRPVPLIAKNTSQNQSLDLYKNLWENNIFHTGPIPLKLKESEEINMEPVISSLPFKLKGTIVHLNSIRSVASIAVQGGKTLSYQQGDPIESQAEIKAIQRGKVIFFNQNNNRLEYIVLSEEESPLLSLSYKKKSDPSTEGLIQRKGLNRFQVKRSDVEEYLQKLPEVLNQARVVPHRSKEGEITGWRFASIDKDSVFEKLGFEKGDILKKVDGKTVQSYEEALDLFDKLRGESKVKIVLEKDGKDQDFEYNVRENAPIR